VSRCSGHSVTSLKPSPQSRRQAIECMGCSDTPGGAGADSCWGRGYPDFSQRGICAWNLRCKGCRLRRTGSRAFPGASEALAGALPAEPSFVHQIHCAVAQRLGLALPLAEDAQVVALAQQLRGARAALQVHHHGPCNHRQLCHSVPECSSTSQEHTKRRGAMSAAPRPWALDREYSQTGQLLAESTAQRIILH